MFLLSALTIRPKHIPTCRARFHRGAWPSNVNPNVSPREGRLSSRPPRHILVVLLALGLGAVLGMPRPAEAQAPSSTGSREKTTATPAATPTLPPIPGWHRTRAHVLVSDLDPLIHGERNEAPDIVFAPDGTLWTAWVGYESGPERIMVRRRGPEDVEWSPQIVLLGKGLGPTARPRLAARDDDVWITWAEITEDNFEIQLAHFHEGKLRDTQTLSDGSHHAFRPTIALDADGIPWVAWEEFLDDEIRLRVLRVSSDASAFSTPTWIAPSRGLNQRPSLVRGSDGTMLLAWDRYEGGHYDIELARITASEIIDIIDITKDSWIDQAPGLFHASDGRTWLAWHSNRPSGRSASAFPGRRLELIALDGRGYRNIRAGAPPTLSIREQGGIPDVLEFPSLAMGHAGRLYLFSRRGQGYVGMYVDGTTWSPPFDLGEPGWGGRGRELRVAIDRRGNLHVVGRFLHKAARRVIQPPPIRPRPIALSSRLHPFPYQPAGHRKRRFSARAGKGSGHALTSSIIHRPEVINHRISSRWKADDAVRAWYFGDLHTHSWLSDGCGDPDEIFTRSRDTLGLDFVALTDHDVSNGNRLAPHEWAYISLLTAFFNDPGHFVTIPAYEWTSPPTIAGGFGHRNVYFESPPAHLFGVDLEAPDTMRLFELLKKAGGFAIPHHTSWTGTDWEHFDPKRQPLFEIVSLHGNSEKADGHPIRPRIGESATYAVDGLDAGYHFGFVGGSDGHGVPWHYGVSRQEDVWTTGLTGVLAAYLDRRSLISALRARQTVATSGIRTAIRVRVGSAHQGERLNLRALSHIPAFLHGTADVTSELPLATVEWVRDGRTMATWRVPGGEKAMAATFTLSIEPGHHAYYVRVTHRSGDMAWSSPITIDTRLPSTP